MSKEQYTPGPWEAEYGTDGYYYINLKGGPDLREVDGGANARLIAAAPDLLEALKDIRDIGQTDFGPAAAARMLDKAKQAIARAEGK